MYNREALHFTTMTLPGQLTFRVRAIATLPDASAHNAAAHVRRPTDAWANHGKYNYTTVHACTHARWAMDFHRCRHSIAAANTPTRRGDAPARRRLMQCLQARVRVLGAKRKGHVYVYVEYEVYTQARRRDAVHKIQRAQFFRCVTSTPRAHDFISHTRIAKQ